ncbi:MAG: hypothetical protein PHS30_05375, partial [Bacteroidales bacterium]|nr:hypothetical protein [Bacteroidales bacterium]
MKNKILYSAVILIGFLPLLGCVSEASAPDFSQPLIQLYVEKGDSIAINDSTYLVTGPLKDYENDSEVTYRLSITSEKPLSKFKVTTTSDAFSRSSKVIKTIPEGVIDSLGNFTGGVKNVVVYYTYHIHPLTAPSTKETLTFTVLNDLNNASAAYHSFSVIKKGSTAGNRLNVIDLSWSSAMSNGIGTQESLFDDAGGTRPRAMNMYKRGNMFCFNFGYGLMRKYDAVSNASEIDFVGYQTRYAGTLPVLTNNQYYL